MIRDVSNNIFVLFFLAIVVIISCKEEKSVEKDYLKSEEYTSFKERTDQEIKQNTQINESFEWSLQQFTSCKDNHLTIPFELDSQKIEKLLQRMTEKCIINREGESLKLLGKSNNSDLLVRWVLLERETAYRDQELIAVIFQDRELKSFKTVGVFQKNPSRKISSDIKVENQTQTIQISSRTDREILYPFEQENTVLTTYEIDDKGGIRQL